MSDGERSYYDVLGVVPNASQDDIKRAYRRLAKAYHPDVNRDPDADARFKEINEANQILSAPDRRAQYDGLVLMNAMQTEHEQEKRVRYEEWRQTQGGVRQSANRVRNNIRRSIRWGAVNRMKNRFRRFLE